MGRDPCPGLTLPPALARAGLVLPRVRVPHSSWVGMHDPSAIASSSPGPAEMLSV